MEGEAIIRILKEALIIILLVSAGPMLGGIVVSFVMSLFQATTQLQERTLSDVPKLLVVYLLLGLLGGWMLTQIVAFTRVMFEGIVLVR